MCIYIKYRAFFKSKSCKIFTKGYNYIDSQSTVLTLYILDKPYEKIHARSYRYVCKLDRRLICTDDSP